MEKTTEEKIAQLQMIEQGMQNFLLQKQQFQAQIIEIESALKELEKSECNIDISLNTGDGCASSYTCDFSPEYVRINAHYLS